MNRVYEVRSMDYPHKVLGHVEAPINLMAGQFWRFAVKADPNGKASRSSASHSIAMELRRFDDAATGYQVLAFALLPAVWQAVCDVLPEAVDVPVLPQLLEAGWIAWSPGDNRPRGQEWIEWVNAEGSGNVVQAFRLRWGDEPNRSCSAPVVKYRIVSPEYSGGEPL